MNKKGGFLAAYWVDFVAYLMFALVIVLFYFVYAQGATPIKYQASISKVNAEANLAALYYLKMPLGNDTNMADYMSLAAVDHERDEKSKILRLSAAGRKLLGPALRAYGATYVSPFHNKIEPIFTGSPHAYNWYILVFSDYHYLTKNPQEKYPYYVIKTPHSPKDPGKATIWLPAIEANMSTIVEVEARAK